MGPRQDRSLPLYRHHGFSFFFFSFPKTIDEREAKENDRPLPGAGAGDSILLGLLSSFFSFFFLLPLPCPPRRSREVRRISRRILLDSHDAEMAAFAVGPQFFSFLFSTPRTENGADYGVQRCCKDSFFWVLFFLPPPPPFSTSGSRVVNR